MKNKTDLILNTTEELMCTMTNPAQDITVDMIAKKAGIGKGSIYYYFKSKEEIIDAVIERSYSMAINEYFERINKQSTTAEKLKTLFHSMLTEEFENSRKNVIIPLHVQDDLLIHQKMMMIAIKTVSPILTEILSKGQEDGSIHTEAPKESAEMIVAMLVFLLNKSFFPADDESMFRKLRLYAKVLETCFKTEKGSFDFLFTPTVQ